MKMQHHKTKNNLSEIEDYCKNTSSILIIFSQLIGQFDLRYINHLFSGVKKRGITGFEVFRTLFVLRFLDFDNVRQLIISGVSKEVAHQKDVLYSFLNNPSIPWRKIMRLFFKQTHSIILKNTLEQDNTEPKCLVLDDTILEKTGKTIEKLGKVFDHCTHIYQLGMKVLTLGYYDGKSFVPIDFSIHNEPGKNKNRGLKKKELDAQFSKERPAESPGYERKKEISKDKISIALEMIKRCHNKWLKIDYVLADSWFVCEKFIKGIKNINEKLHIIGQMKTNRIVLIEGKSYKADKIPELKRQNIQYSNIFKCHYISLKINYKGIEMRGYWIKMKGQNNWNLLISTHQGLSFTKAMKCYKNRWSIEVFFKDCKQNLGLKSCQSTDFDAHIATVSIVYMNYMVLALKKRFEDYETLGVLFRDFKDLMIKETIIKRIWNVLLNLFDSVFAFMGIDWEQFISTMINRQNEILKNLNRALQPLYTSNASVVS